MQTFVYFSSFPGDQLYIKLLVYFSYAIELVQVVCTAANIFYWFGTGFGNIAHLNNVHLSSFDTPLIGSIIAFVVQIFFCYRIWVLRMNRRRLLCLIACWLIALISFVQLVGGVAGAAVAHHEGKFSFIASSRTALVYEVIWLFGEALADVLISVTMTYLLLGTSDEIFVGRPSVATRIVRLIVLTNALTASFAVLSLVLRLTFRGKIYFALPTFILGKLYSNTLLATFNHRLYLRQEWSQNNSGLQAPTGISVSRTIETLTTKTDPTIHKEMSSLTQLEQVDTYPSGEETLPMVGINPFIRPGSPRGPRVPDSKRD